MMSELERDFFLKLCHYNSFERYNCKQALQHPFITGDSETEIPETQKQGLRRFDLEMKLRTALSSLAFIGMIRQQTESRNSLIMDQETNSSHCNSSSVYQSERLHKHSESLSFQ